MARGGSRAAAATAPVVPAPAPTPSVLNPVTHHFEFVGPYIGPVGIILGLPVLTWALTYYCNAHGWPAIPAADVAAQQAWSSLTPESVLKAVQSTWSTEVFFLYVVWWLSLALMYVVVPGPVGKGIVLRDGRQLSYPLNGLNSLLIVLAGAAVWQYAKPFGVSLSWVYDSYTQIIVSAIVFSSLLSAFLYASSFTPDRKGGERLLAEGGNSGIPVYDFFIGRELNPRVLFDQLDLKYFCELRPGLFLWLLFNVSAAVKMYETTGGTLSPSMIIVLLFEGYYVLDSVLNEAAILTTMDITMDGFGFMLAFGDLAWVPGVYTLQARYLAVHPGASSLVNAVAVLVGAIGMYVFRASNSQKDAWKRSQDASDPAFKGIQFVQTAGKTKLLAEGSWWGVARHVNYFGDWIMSVAWCLPTGFATPFTYFYPAYFAVLLVHREMRDEEKCAAKYGKAWEEYCRRVPYKIIPHVY